MNCKYSELLQIYQIIDPKEKTWNKYGRWALCNNKNITANKPNYITGKADFIFSGNSEYIINRECIHLNMDGKCIGYEEVKI